MEEMINNLLAETEKLKNLVSELITTYNDRLDEMQAGIDDLQNQWRHDIEWYCNRGA